MISHLKNYKPSLSDLSHEQKRKIHISVRSSRMTVKQIPKKKKPATKIEKRNKKLNDVVSQMSPEEMGRLLEEIKLKKESLK